MRLDEARPQTLIIGYGNPGRQDDGLGPALIDRLELRALPDLLLQSNYQLTVEDALELTHAARVVFVDAALNLTQRFRLARITANPKAELGSHTLAPDALLQLCKTLYQHEPEAWMLAIRGYEFDQFDEHLSHAAETGLNEAEAFLLTWLERS